MHQVVLSFFLPVYGDPRNSVSLVCDTVQHKETKNVEFKISRVFLISYLVIFIVTCRHERRFDREPQSNFPSRCDELKVHSECWKIAIKTCKTRKSLLNIRNEWQKEFHGWQSAIRKIGQIMPLLAQLLVTTFLYNLPRFKGICKRGDGQQILYELFEIWSGLNQFAILNIKWLRFIIFFLAFNSF